MSFASLRIPVVIVILCLTITNALAQERVNVPGVEINLGDWFSEAEHDPVAYFVYAVCVRQDLNRKDVDSAAKFLSLFNTMVRTKQPYFDRAASDVVEAFGKSTDFGEMADKSGYNSKTVRLRVCEIRKRMEAYYRAVNLWEESAFPGKRRATIAKDCAHSAGVTCRSPDG